MTPAGKPLGRRQAALVTLFADRAKTAIPPLWIWIHDKEFRTVEDWWHPEVSARLVARGLRQYFTDTMPTDEHARLHVVARAIRNTAEIHEPEHLESYLWLTSFLLYGRYVEACAAADVEAGEKTVLVNLPFPLQHSPAFFLGQWWVRALLDIWHAEGEIHKINRVLLMSPGRGKRSYAKKSLIRQRDWAIFHAVEELRRNGLGYNEALHKMVPRMRAQAFGNFPLISRASIKRVYDQMRQLVGPLRRAGEREI